MKRIVYMLIGGIEVLIGITTLAFLTFIRVCNPAGVPVKSLNVCVFVAITAAVSFILGMGLLRGKEWARILLMFFSGYIIMEKILIFAGVLSFNGEMIGELMSVRVKDGISFLYHLVVLMLLFSFGRREA